MNYLITTRKKRIKIKIGKTLRETVIESDIHAQKKVCSFILHSRSYYYIWDKVSKNGPSEICGRQPLKNLT